MVPREKGNLSLCFELPTERDAIDVAQRFANRLAETSNVRHTRFITVTDEHGKVVGEVPVRRKH
jgi:hypothetical protein